ncbi:MAG: FAD-dependent oxidoreductase [Candidatus Taylorbacteria bacterium]
MKIEEGTTWDVGVEIPGYEALEGSIETDVAIVGGGITGMLCAYLLTSAGKKVALVEKNKIGFGATGVTTAFLTQMIDTDPSKLVAMYGKEKTKLIFQSHADAISAVEKIVGENKIDCEFARCPFFEYARSEKENGHLKKEGKVLRDSGISAEFKTDGKLGFANSGYLEVPNQAKFHPMKYLSALVGIASQKGAKIYEKTEVTEIAGDGPFSLKTASGDIKAGSVIVATYSPFDKKLFFNKGQYTSYVIEAEIEAGIFKDGTYLDGKNPYHYFRVDRGDGKDRLIVGGEDHRSQFAVDASKNYQALLEFIKNLLGNSRYTIVRKWEGPISEPVDGLAFIGPLKKKNIFYATGFSGNGMTYSAIAGRIISDQILNKTNPYSELYSASRKSNLKAMSYKGIDFTLEFIHGALKNSFVYRKKEI